MNKNSITTIITVTTPPGIDSSNSRTASSPPKPRKTKDELYHTKVDTWVNLEDKDGHFAYYNPDLSHFTLVDASEIKEFTDSNSNVINYEFLYYQRTTY